MKKFQGSSLYLTPEGLRDQTGEIILTKREILDELVGPGAEAPRPEGGDKERMDWLQSTVHYEPGDDVATIDNDFITEKYLMEAKGDLRQAVDLALQQRVPQEGSTNK